MAVCAEWASQGRVWGARNVGVSGPQWERTTLAREVAAAIGAYQAGRAQTVTAGAGGRARD